MVEQSLTAAELAECAERDIATTRRVSRQARHEPVLVSCIKCGTGFHPTMARLLSSTFKCNHCVAKEQRERYSRQYPHSRRNIRWTEADDAAIIAGATALPGRTKAKIQRRREELVARGLIAPAFVVERFSQKDIAFLKRHFGKRLTSWIAETLGRSRRSVTAKALKLGLDPLPKRLRHPRKEAPRLTATQRRQVPEVVAAAVPRSLPSLIREEIIAMMVVDVLDRKLAFAAITTSVATYRTRYYALHPEKGAPLSLDMKAFDDGSATIGDRIDASAFHF